MNKESVLLEVPIDYLQEGMILQDDVYTSDGAVLLIPKGERISARKLQQLSYFGTKDNCVATYQEAYFQIMEQRQAVQVSGQKEIESSTGYTEMKTGVNRILTRAKHAKAVEHSEVEVVVEDVLKKMRDIEPVEIFKCMHLPRPIDEKLQRHLLNVSLLNGMMGTWLDCSEEEIEALVLVGVLHDVGKTKIPEEILDIPRKYTPEERKVVRMHPVYSSELLDDQFDETVKSAILHHHERGDGSGYPDGLVGEDIPFFARITSITDVYDAMVSKRCYKEAVVPFEVLNGISNMEHPGLDPMLSAVFVKNMIKYYKNRPVKMSDGTKGEVVYIPPNDISHPVMKVNGLIKQTDEIWYPVRMM